MRARTDTHRRARRQGRPVEELTEDVRELVKRGVLQPDHADAGASAGGTRQVSDKVLITQNETAGRIAGDAMTRLTGKTCPSNRIEAQTNVLIYLRGPFADSRTEIAFLRLNVFEFEGANSVFFPSNFKPKTGAPPKLGSIISETRCSLGPALIVQICHRDVGLVSCKVNIHLINCCAVDQEGGSLERVDNVV